MTDEIEEWSWVRVEGADAETYLAGQITQVVEDGARFALLEPTSEVIAAGDIAIGDSYVSLRVPTNLADTVVRRLERFRMRSKVSISVEPAAPLYDSAAARISDGWPGTAELSGSLTPHAYGATFIERSVSFTKGCYTGQELVGRLDARGGNTPWRVGRFIGSAKDVAVEISHGPNGPTGVTSTTRSENVDIGLAVVHRTFAAPSTCEWTWV
jgi:folate-binding protein YgfZ